MTEQNNPSWHGTTIISVRKGNQVVIAGDGQVSLGNTVIKASAQKVRRIGDGSVIAGFAGATADAFTLFERLESKLEKHPNQLTRAAVELAKEWRTDKYLRRLEALLTVADANVSLLITGQGDVLEPENNITGIGSGGNYALSAARALIETDLTAEEIAKKSIQIAADICVFTNNNITSEKIEFEMQAFSPREIVSELDRFIIGQDDAKKAVAIALRNRWRRQQLEGEIKEEILPKNILMVGPTGVGKTEISRRLSKLAQAPFIKVEATKFTEVGYVGRDVEQIVRDLIEIAITMVKQSKRKEVKAKAQLAAEERVLDCLVGPGAGSTTRESFRKKLRNQEIDDKEIEIEIQDTGSATIDLQGSGGAGVGMINLNDMLGKAMGNKTRKKKVKVGDSYEILVNEESDKLIDHDQIVTEAKQSVEDNGIVFIDEIDKVCARSERLGGDVSREGVQRDLLPLIEGTVVTTKHGTIKTDHILFIASGAFQLAKPSDLLPELQGRLPIRVALNALSQDDFKRILKEPKFSLIKQYEALMKTEDVEISFTEDGIDALATLAVDINTSIENIGARRLHTILERVLEEISFSASDRKGQAVKVDADYVKMNTSELSKDTDLSKFIL